MYVEACKGCAVRSLAGEGRVTRLRSTALLGLRQHTSARPQPVSASLQPARQQSFLVLASKGDCVCCLLCCFRHEFSATPSGGQKNGSLVLHRRVVCLCSVGPQIELCTSQMLRPCSAATLGPSQQSCPHRLWPTRSCKARWYAEAAHSRCYGSTCIKTSVPFLRLERVC